MMDYLMCPWATASVRSDCQYFSSESHIRLLKDTKDDYKQMHISPIEKRNNHKETQNNYKIQNY